MSIRDDCPLCGGRALTDVVSRQDVPVHQNLVYGRQAEALAAVRGDLLMVACHACGFVFNRAFDGAKLDYGQQYDNTQLSSALFQEHVNRLVRLFLDERGIRGSHVVEVGCGKGAFIRALVADPEAGNTGVGFDPTYVGPREDLDGRLRFEHRFYDESCADELADAVVSRHVIEHVPQPLELLRAMAAALRERPGARVFLETPCVEWILRHDVVWDFFYEHCSLFTGRSLTTACETAGFTVESVSHVFGGQYLWLEAINRPPERVTRQPGEVPALARRFSALEQGKRAQWQTSIKQHAGSGGVAVWGAAAKGVTFACLADPHRELLTCLVDINPAKQGGYVPVTGHPIVAPDALPGLGVTCVLVMNPNYLGEIQAMVRERQWPITVLDADAL